MGLGAYALVVGLGMAAYAATVAGERETDAVTGAEAVVAGSGNSLGSVDDAVPGVAVAPVAVAGTGRIPAGDVEAVDNSEVGLVHTVENSAAADAGAAVDAA